MSYKVYFNNTHKVWFARWRDGDRYRTKNVPVDVPDDEASANAWLARWWEECAAEGKPNAAPAPTQPTIRNLAKRWEDYVASQPNAHPDTRYNAESVLRLHVFPYRIADIPIDAMKLGDCVDWIDALKAAGKAPYSVRNIVQAVRTFFSDARGKGWIDRENFFNDSYVKKKLKGAQSLAGKDTIVALSLEEARRILSYKGDGVPTIRQTKYVLGVTSGLRAGELSGLKWSDVDLESPIATVQVDRQLVKGHSRPGAPVFRDPKKGSFRTLPLHPLTVSALKRWKEVDWEVWVGRKPTPDDPVFPNPDGWFICPAQADRFRRDLGAYNINPLFEGKHEITFHALRRTFLTLLTDSGVPEAEVKALAGHAALGVTRKHYIRKNIDRFVLAISKLPLEEST